MQDQNLIAKTNELLRMTKCVPEVRSIQTDEGETLYYIAWDIPEISGCSKRDIRTRYLHTDGFWRLSILDTLGMPTGIFDSDTEAQLLLARHL
jgi:hypothetical protein